MAVARHLFTRGVKEWGKRGLRMLFEAGQRLGVNVLPRHFYSEIPNVRDLRRNRTWQRPYSLVGIQGTDLDVQLAWLREVCPPDLAVSLPAMALHDHAGRANGAVGFGPIESDILYCIIRTLAPRRMIQIGAGASTWVALRAARDAQRELDITCIDPFPTAFLERADRNGEIELRRCPVQSLEPSELTQLGRGDILFIDSTHTVSPGSDVSFVVLEVLPRLSPGVLVHFHDVTIPYDYAPGILDRDIFFWTESVLLQAYLTDNSRVRINLGCAMLHDRALERVREIIPTYEHPLPLDRGLSMGRVPGVFPSSMWLEVLQ